MKQLIFICMVACTVSACSTQTNHGFQTAGLTVKQKRVVLAKINTQLGLAYLAKGEIPRAKQKLLLASKQNPNSPTSLDALAYFWETVGNNHLADHYYKTAINLAPYSGRALNNYGAYLCRQKHYKIAEKYLLAAANEPNYVNSAAAFENAGLCELGVPNLQKAKEYFLAALRQDPRLPTAYLELSKIYYQEKNYKLSKKYLLGYHSLNSSELQN